VEVKVKDQMDTKTLTCVYTINDRKAFAEEQKRINKNFRSSNGLPWSITAISIGHEIHRLSLIEEAHDENRHDLFSEIFGLIDPSLIESINHLKGFKE